MRMEGQGTCNVSVEFGDGNTQEFSVELPHTFTHVYSVARGYNVTAAARPPCEGGRHTARLEVQAGGGGSAAPRLSGLTVSPTPGTPGAATIQVAGNGTCSYVLDYGDGNNERRNSALPDRVRHVFPSGGTFVVVATAESPCRGRVQDTLTIARSGGAVEKVLISPSSSEGARERQHHDRRPRHVQGVRGLWRRQRTNRPGSASVTDLSRFRASRPL